MSVEWNDAIEEAALKCESMAKTLQRDHGEGECEESHGALSCAAAVRALKRPEATYWRCARCNAKNYHNGSACGSYTCSEGKKS